MAMDRDVTIDFNADISGYSASMGQMIQQTSQYSAAADGMIGKIGKLNNVVMAGVKSMSAFTQTNKVATAQAAAYQQQLSKIETSAKVNNKSFKELEKTTKGLAKDFPIGMKQAVEQVESLQEAGVTTNKEIGQLAKTFTKLGAATGTFGPEMGKNMLQLNRTFENGTESMEKYADSLTTVTHMYGANAGAVTSFAKSIAPVAATVGMSETSVIGLSTAFSRLGEDGFAAANTFNKVMLDMSKSIREGTPEAKIYAEVMGTTSESLRKTWETNPAEGFIDFVEAIKSQGEGGIRSLEMLGLEGVRTQKTIMSLANSGNMREIVQKAQSSYGSGATGTAAETAMGGVNDQLTMLNETMAQTTATAGKPFLGFLEKVLQVANSISKVIASLVESDVIQGFAKAIGVAGGAFGLTKLLASGATLGSLPLTAVKTVLRSGFGQGLAAGRAGTELAEGERAGLGYRAGAFMNRIGGPGDGSPWYTGPMSAVRRGGNVLGNAMAAYWNSNASMILRSLDRPGITTEAGQRARAAARNVNLIRQDPGILDPAYGGSVAAQRAAMKEAGKDAGKQFSGFLNQTGGASKALGAWTNQLKASGAFWASMGGSAARGGVGAVRGLGGMMGSAVGLPLGAGAATALGGVGLAAGAGLMLYKSRKAEDEARERGGQNAYRMFNDFAEKAGLATKGLVSFAQALSESTNKIAAESKTREEAFEITEKEIIQSKSAGYERAYSTRGADWMNNLLPGKPSAEKEAIRLRGMLGSSASPESINRIQMDLANQFGKEFAEKVTKTLKEIYEGGEGGKPMTSKEVQSLLHEQSEKSRFLGVFGTKESQEFAEMEEAERARAQNVERAFKGVDLQQAEGYAAVELGVKQLQAAGEARQAGGGLAAPGTGTPQPTTTGVYGVPVAAGKAPDTGEQKMETLIQTMADELHLTTEQQESLTRTAATFGASSTGLQGGYGMTSAVAPQPLNAGTLLAATPGLEDLAETWMEKTAKGGAAEGGFANLTPEQKETMGLSATEIAAKEAVDRTNELGGVAGTLVTDMAGAGKAFRDWAETTDEADKTFENWVKTGSEGATDLQKAFAAVKDMPGDAAKQQKLTTEIVKNTVAQAKATGVGAAGAGQIITTAMTTSTGEELPALQAARRLAQQEMTLAGGQGGLAQQQGVIETGRIAEKGLERTDITAETRAQYQQDADAGKQAQIARMQQMQQFMTQMHRQQEDFYKNRARMVQSYEIQMGRQAEDFAKQRRYMIQDYHRGVERAEEDFYTQRARAQRDFDKQVTRQAEQTAKNMMDPYQRIGPQMVTDMAVLTQSLVEQNKSVQDQLASVDRLSQMGLSKDAIDQLKLMDPSQNQQVQRMLADAISNPGGIDQINQLIEQRMKLGYELNTSEFNKDFQNMKEDFGQSMDDMSDDFEKNMKRGEQDFKRGLRRNAEAFATAQSRAAADHRRALDQMDEDNQEAITRAQEDLVGMAEGFTDSYVDIQRKFLQDLANLPSNLSQATKDTITKILQDEIDAIEEANTKAANPPPSTGSGHSGQGGDNQEPEGEQGPSAYGDNPLGHKRSDTFYPWYSYRGGGFHGGADVGHKGFGAYSVVKGRVIYSGVAPGGDKQNPKGSYGRHVIISDGKHDFLYAHLAQRQVSVGQTVKTGDRVGTIGNTGNTKPIGSGHHLHFEVRPHGQGHKSAVNPNPWLAEGGVVTRHIQPHVGEGGPEAVIPLNERGAQYLADALSKASMARYWQNSDAKKTHSQQHSSPVTNNVYTYDQRTQFMGEVKVESQDPEDMARKLAARERRNRLARKTGSAA